MVQNLGEEASFIISTIRDENSDGSDLQPQQHRSLKVGGPSLVMSNHEVNCVSEEGTRATMAQKDQLK
ncbi:hypothetical protein AMECASPLE_027688, partial [Ameca splendens]